MATMLETVGIEVEAMDSYEKGKDGHRKEDH
jgi:hypothetical protein